MSSSPESGRDRTKQRPSILKPLGPKNPQTEPTSPKLTRQVSFARARSIKVFAQDPEQNTIWDNSYQEFVNQSDSTQSPQDQGVMNMTDMELTCQFPSTSRATLPVERNLTLNQCQGVTDMSDMELTCQFPSTSRATLPVERNLTLNQFQGVMDMTDMELTCQFPSTSRATLPVERNLTLNQFQGVMDMTDMELTCQFPSTSRATLPVERNLTINQCQGVIDMSDMELTCQFPSTSRATLPVERNLTLNQCQGVMDMSDMELTCQFPSTSRATPPVERNLTLNQFQGVMDMTDMELTCQFPSTSRATLPVERNLTLNQFQGVMDMTDMELTCQFPSTSRATLPVERNVGFNKSESALQDIDMEFTCQIPTTMLPTSTNFDKFKGAGKEFPLSSKTILPADVEESRVDLEHTSMAPSKAMLPVEIIVNPATSGNDISSSKAPTPNKGKLNKTKNLKPNAPIFSQSPEPSFQINLSTISDNNTCQISSFVKPKLESFINSINEVREDTRAQLSQHFSHVSFPNVTNISDLSTADLPRGLEVPDVSFSTVPLSNRFLQAYDTYFVNRKRNYDKETEVNTSSDSQDSSHILERTKLDYVVESEDCSSSQSNIRQALANVRLDEFVCPIKKVDLKKKIEKIEQQRREIETELLNFQLDQYVLPDLIDKEDINEGNGESYEETQCQAMQISSPQKLPTLEEKIRELQNRSQNYWTLEGTEGSTYTFSTLCGTVIFTVQLNTTNEIVINIDTKTSLHRDCLPLNVYINRLFVARMRSDNITAAIGPQFNILSLLDYVKLTYIKFLEFYMDMNEYLTKYSATIDENLIAKFELANDSLVVFFEVFVDLKNLENLTKNDIKIEQKIGEIKQNDVKMLAMNCPKNSDFIHSYINKIEEYLVKRKKYLRKV